MPDYVLIAEDDTATAVLLQDMLGLVGITARAVTTGDAALEQIRKDPPDLVVVDLWMPGLNGFQLCEAIKADPNTALIPTLVVTGHTEKQHRLRAMEAGADDLLTKPVDRVEFQTRVRSMVTAHARARSLVQFRHVVAALLAALEARDPSGREHLARVARLADRIACRLGLTAQSRMRLEQAAWLHDIGKLALNLGSRVGVAAGCAGGSAGPGDGHGKARDEDDRAGGCYRLHPEVGERILQPIPAAGPLLPLIRGHHERWDGSGFPDGLPGAEQSVELQVLAIANHFDRLLARAAGDTEAACRALRQETAEGRWNPTVADALLGVVVGPHPHGSAS